jgi:hypothetical protein
MSKLKLHRDNSKGTNLLEALQAAVINRYTRSFGANDPVIYEFTQDRALIHQYHRLQEAMYRRMYDAPEFNAGMDVYDKLSHILIARRGRLCLGGCRLTIREPDEMWGLPLEAEGFNLRQAFPEIPLHQARHGEISKFTVMEDCGDEDIFLGLCQLMYQKVINEKIHYLFVQSNYSLARNWRLIANRMGVKTTKIRDDIVLPEHPIIHCGDIYITISDLSSFYPKPESPEVDTQSVVFSEEAKKTKPHLELLDS